MKAMNVKGFTLIELMVAIAILAIVGSIAIPVYYSYTVKAHVSELLRTGAAAKTAVSDVILEYQITQATFTSPSSTTLFANLASSFPFSSTANVSSLIIQSGGTATSNGAIYIQGTQATANTAIKFIPSINVDGSVSWTCYACSNGPGAKYLPNSCSTTTTCP